MSTRPAPQGSPAAQAAASEAVAAARARHWRRTRRLSAALLGAWFLVAFGATWIARDLDFAFFGWPFGFWVAAQGGVLAFVAILVAFAAGMARIDRGLRRELPPPQPPQTPQTPQTPQRPAPARDAR